MEWQKTKLTNLNINIMKKTTWSDILKIKKPMEKKDYEKLILLAKNEVIEWKDFIKLCKSKIKNL